VNIAVNARFLYSEQLEGVHRYIYETTVRMAAAHPEDRFVLFYDRAYSKALIYPENVVQVIIPLQTRHPLLWHIWLEYLLPYYFDKYQIDVFYSGDTYMSLRAKQPTVLVCHDLAYLHYPGHIPFAAKWHYRRFFPEYHRKAAHIIAVSESTKKDIVQQYQISPEKITVAPNAVNESYKVLNPDEKQDVRNSYTDGCPYFIYLGALHPRKNIIQMIHAFRIFKDQYQSRHKLILAGRLAWKSGDIEAAMANNPDIIHTGFVGAQEKKLLLGGAEALVYVSLFEGFGIPLLEAMASGVPVITSSVSSMPEVAGSAAVLVDPNDCDAISEAMYQISHDGHIAQNLIQEGLKRYRQFDWNSTAEIIYDRIKEVLHDN
jgi:glycosyltransferase involved in cell wall biosynthesis